MREVILMTLVFLTGGVFVQTAAGTGIYNYGPRDFMQSVFYLPYETTATLANRFDLVVVSLACVFQGLSLLSLSLGFHVVIGIVVIMTDVIIKLNITPENTHRIKIELNITPENTHRIKYYS
nr:uncharacterized protein LOC113812410 [Penaeus vannamei]